jgi:hypothetical protein
LKILHKKLLKLNLFLAFIIFCLPAFLYFYLLFSKTTIINFCLFSYEVQNFKNAQYLIYFLSGNFYIILFLSVWFLTISDWWRYFLLPTIVFVIFQLYPIIEDVIGVQQNYAFVGLGIGVLYSVLLHLVHRKSKIYMADSIHMITFDIIKLLSNYSNEKRIVNLKQKFIANQGFEIPKDSERNNLNIKVKALESYLMQNGRFIYMPLKKRFNFKIEYLIGVMLLIAPFFLKVYTLIPLEFDGVLNIKSFTYDTKFSSLRLFFYYFNIKFLHIYLLSIWFFTTRTLLKYGILFNLVIAVVQIVQVLNNKVSRIDENELWTALPIMIPILITFILLHKIIKYKSKNEILNEEIEQEIQQVITELNSLDNNKNKIVQELILLRNKKNNLSKEDYFSQLKALKSKLQNTLVN